MIVSKFSQLSGKVKAVLIAAIIYGASMQVDGIKNLVTPYLANHPKLTSAFAVFIFCIGLLHNPMAYSVIAGALNIQKIDDTTAKVSGKISVAAPVDSSK